MAGTAAWHRSPPSQPVLRSAVESCNLCRSHRPALGAMVDILIAELERIGAASRDIVRPWNHEANVENVLECVKMVCGDL